MRFTLGEVEQLRTHFWSRADRAGVGPVFNAIAFGLDPGNSAADNNTAIANAIDAALGVTSGVVELPISYNGNPYEFTSITNRGITLRSTGGVLKIADNTAINAGTSYFFISNLDGLGGYYANARFEHLIIDGNRANNTTFTVADVLTIGGENAVAQGLYIYDAPDSAVMFSKAKNSALYDLRIDGAYDAGIYVNDGTGNDHYENLILGCRITGAASAIAIKRIAQRTIVALHEIFDCGTGITTEHASSATDYAKNLTIIANRMRRIGFNDGGWTWSATGGVGLDIRGADYTDCSHNRVEDVLSQGAIIQGAKHVIFQSNILTNVNGTGANSIGILFKDRLNSDSTYRSSEYCKVLDNHAEGFTTAAIELGRNSDVDSPSNQHNKFSRNTGIAGGNGHGMVIRATSTNPIHTKDTFSDNTLQRAGTGFDLVIQTGALDHIWANNVLVNNAVSGSLDQVNQISAYRVGSKRHSMGTAAPTANTWAVGDTVWNTTPTAGGTLCWVCTTAGTPGTWSAVTLS